MNTFVKLFEGLPHGPIPHNSPDRTDIHFSLIFVLSSGLILEIGYQSSFHDKSRHASITTLAAVNGFPFSVDLFSPGGIAGWTLLVWQSGRIWMAASRRERVTMAHRTWSRLEGSISSS